MGHDRRFDGEGEGRAGKPVILLLSSSSSDEEAEANSKRRRPEEEAGSVPVIDLSSSSDEAEVVPVQSAATGAGEAPADVRKPKKRRKKKKKMKKVDVLSREEEALGTVDSVVTEVNEAYDNIILRKLLRGPRYFDLGNSNWDTCYNCGAEGHKSVDCTVEKRQKPCFVCGMFGHSGKQCAQANDCFFCKRRGHLAKECPDKDKKVALDAKICLRCGDIGHDMLSCRNGYDPDDLKETQCYVCKTLGHLCCVDFVDIGPKEVSCYSCAQFGHTGLGCAKSRGENSAVASPTLCYKCGEEGHFARGCTRDSKSRQWVGESSTPTRRFAKKSRDYQESRSVPRDFWEARNNRSLQHEGRSNETDGKLRPRGGWIVDELDVLPNKKAKAKVNGWFPSTPIDGKGHKLYSSDSGGHQSRSLSYNKQRPSQKTPATQYSSSPHENGYSASRFGSSRGYYRRF